jgi:poly-beta-1,6-N-acetyl-D-glucosamine synthase
MSSLEAHYATIPPSHRYVLIMPTRDDEDFLEATLDCITNQTLLPAELVIVDDGSSDRTGAIAEAAAAAHPWIQVVHRPDRGCRRVGPGVIEAFYDGYAALRTRDYEYIGKIDGDITFGHTYFERIIAIMSASPTLGGASGKVFHPVDRQLHEERIIDEMVSGQIHFWRRPAWEAIGGFVREVMWDGITFHRARMCGWQTHSFPDTDLRIFHHRLMGSSEKSIVYGRMRWGRGQWFMGTHPLYIVASGINRMRERPYILGGLLIVAGYVEAMVRRAPRYGDPEFRRHLHRWQLARLGLRRRRADAEATKHRAL